MQAATILVSLTFSPLVTSLTQATLPSLFSHQISDAKCLAKCQSLPEQTEAARCYDICKIRQDNPATDLCRYPAICTAGCAVACEDTPHHKDLVDQTRFNYFHRESCHLSWGLSRETIKNVVFVVAGQDHGKMWHFVTGNLSSSSLDVSAGLGARYPSIAIIAVDSESVLDIFTVNLPRYQECPREEKDVITVLGDDLITVIILCVVVVALVIILLAILCSKRPAEDTMVRRSNTKYLDSLVASRKRPTAQFPGVKSTKLSPVYDSVIV